MLVATLAKQFRVNPTNLVEKLESIGGRVKLEVRHKPPN